jgi:Domain of unknown function (DUF222)/HNH endonuclease
MAMTSVSDQPWAESASGWTVPGHGSTVGTGAGGVGASQVPGASRPDASREPGASEGDHAASGPGDAAQPTDFGSASKALAAVRAGLDYLVRLDAAALTADEQADSLRSLAAAESVHLAATCRVLSAFKAGAGFAADGAATSTGWLRWQTRITRAAAGATGKWAKRLGAHPAVADALAAGRISPSWARQLCDWSDALPEDVRAAADEQLVGAALAGLGLSDLALLAEEIRIRTAQPDTDGADHFGTRRLWLTEHYQGNARLDGDLTPQAAAALQTVLDALGQRTGPEDDRSREQRDHDALEEACVRLIASKLLPERAGQPVHLSLDIPLSQLLGHADDPASLASATITGTPAPPGADCDAAIIPIVTGTIDEQAAAQAVVRMLAGKLGSAFAGAAASATDATRHGTAPIRPDVAAFVSDMAGGPAAAGLAWRAAKMQAIAQAAALLSGPRGLASWLRTTKLPGPAASLSLPLDVGTATETIPVHLRRAIIRRDQHCRFPGCDQPPAACHVHHLRPRADGGETSLTNCCLLCRFHHLIAIHRWGWTITLHADGTTTARSPDGTKTLHSHPPPVQAA